MEDKLPPEDDSELNGEGFERPPGGLSGDSDSEKSWEINSGALEKMLLAIGGDLESGAREYERIREKLITFFESSGCPTPEDHADVVINRIAKKIDRDDLTFTCEPISYFLGVARMVLKECWRIAKTSPEISESSLTYVEDSPIAKSASEHPDRIRAREEEEMEMDRKLACLSRCLDLLPEQDQAIILAYYRGDKSLKIRNRKKLAEKLGIQMNALRIRVLRIRKSLEICVNDCLSQGSPE